MKDIIIKDGTSRIDRLKEILPPDHFQVDERGFETLLAMGTDYARTLNFYNIKNQVEGDWEALFTSDETVVIGLILSTNLSEIESRFHKFLKLNPGNSRDFFLALSVFNFRLAKKIDFWLKKLKVIGNDTANNLRRRIFELIQRKLAGDFYRLRGFLKGFKKERVEKFKIDFKDFEKVWMAEGAEGLPPGEPIPEVGTDLERLLKSNFYSFYNGVSHIQKRAAEYLEESLKSGNHNPATALYLTFLRLFDHSRNQINGFTEKHHDFYYHDVLKTTPRSFYPDSAYLVFEPDGSKKEVLIESGTSFSAGKDSTKRELIYQAENGLMVTDARVASLHTVFLERDELVSPEKELNFVTGIRVNAIPVSDSIDPSLDGTHGSWPLFGALKDEGRQATFKNAWTGFAVSSPVLHLEEGLRQIDVTLKVGHEPTSGDKDLEEIFDELGGLLHSKRNDALFKAFENLFSLTLSAENGWFEISDYTINSSVVDKSCEPGTIKISFRLKAEDPGIISCDPAVHSGNYPVADPVLRFLINPCAYVYPYSVLKNLFLKQVKIEVEAREIKNLLLYNNIGKVDAGTLFHPFGPIPAMDSYFVVGNFEAAGKKLTAWDLHIKWAGLPRDRGGFEAYYRGYPGDFHDGAFKVNLTLLKDGKWYPDEKKELLKAPLFQSGETGIDDRITITGQGLEHFKPVCEDISEDEFHYDLKSRGGFFKYTLSEPEHAFGHGIYPNLLTKSLLASAKLKIPEEPPNPPYAPMVDEISLDYRAETVINLEQKSLRDDDARNLGEKILQIHPLGFDTLYPRYQPGKNHLAPGFDHSGNLYIGIESSGLSGVLTLFFHMMEDSTLGTDAAPSDISWFYLASNQWKKFDKHDLLSDTTMGFLSSGIVVLNIPGDISRNNSIMPHGLYWLRVSAGAGGEGAREAQRVIKSLCTLISVKTQAMKVCFVNNDNALDHLETNLAEGVIQKPVKSIPGIGNVVQVTGSFGGRPAEKPEQLKIRMRERLKHKDRAITPWDYERLILERFPGLFKVKCFSNMSVPPPDALGQDLRRNLELAHKPGHILIVVIPLLKEKSSIMDFKSMANSLLLKKIKDFSRNIASPFAEIDVINPAYEKIQIRCTVKFKTGKGNGYYIEKLNRDINAYLSPWDSRGYTAEFGWSIRGADMASYIQGLDYIDFATNFSMLHITENEGGRFDMKDTAKQDRSSGYPREIITPVYPWSIAIPVRQHFIETLDQPGSIPAEITGIDELEVGNTFIITGKDDDGATE